MSNFDSTRGQAAHDDSKLLRLPVQLKLLPSMPQNAQVAVLCCTVLIELRRLRQSFQLLHAAPITVHDTLKCNEKVFPSGSHDPRRQRQLKQ